MQQFQINKSDYSKTRIIEIDDADVVPGPGEILVKVERFGFSANNITYAVAGETIGYWKFFKPIGEDPEKWGVLPVWGFADVITSNAEGINKGERLFGYFPPATHLLMTPQEVSNGQFFDGAAHRAELPRGYNIYRRMEAQPGYDRAGDNVQMLLYPLYLTSFSLWDFLKEKNWFGAEQIALISASSKTSIGLAYALADDDQAPPVVGLTSDGNLEFVKGLGIYDDTIAYGMMETSLENKRTAIVDMSGNSEFLGKMHQHLAENMLQTINVGLTHWEDFKPNENIIRERSEFFFAPSQIQKRMKEWGIEEFGKRSTGFFKETVHKSSKWLELRDLKGIEGLNQIYLDMLAGRRPPQEGLLIEVDG